MDVSSRRGVGLFLLVAFVGVSGSVPAFGHDTRLINIDYGNYCGPGYSSGHSLEGHPIWETYICTLSGLKKPVDSLDALCIKHDLAYCSNDAAVQHKADIVFLKEMVKLGPPCTRPPRATHKSMRHSQNSSKEIPLRCNLWKGPPKNPQHAETYRQIAIQVFSGKIDAYRSHAAGK